MDNYIIVLLGIVFFIYRTYANYKKEQEAAKTRDPRAPKEQASAQTRKEASEHPMDIPKWLQDFLPPQPEQQPPAQQRRAISPKQPVSIERSPERSLVTEASRHGGSIAYEPVTYVPMKYVPTERPADLLREYRSLPEKQEIEELKRSVAIHKAHRHQFKRMDAFVIDDKKDVIEVPDFNLREAIIMKAILERPYY